MQKTGKVKLPPGKKVAVNLGCDFDAQSIWDGSFNLLSPANTILKPAGSYRAIRPTPSRISVRKYLPRATK